MMGACVGRCTVCICVRPIARSFMMIIPFAGAWNRVNGISSCGMMMIVAAATAYLLQMSSSRLRRLTVSEILLYAYRNALNHWNNALINVYIELIAIEYNEWPSFGLNYKYIRAWINRNWSILYKKPVIFFSILPISVLTDYNVTWHHPREI